MAKSVRTIIDEFLAVSRFAMVGVSHDGKHFSRSLFKEFLKNGYEVVPVNPHAEQIAGFPAVPKVADIVPGVEQALIITPESQTMSAVMEAHLSGVNRIWLYGISGEKDIQSEVIEYCRQSDMEIVPGYCPFMFLPRAAFPHKIHGAVWKLIGLYPST